MYLVPFKKRNLCSDPFGGFESLQNEINRFFRPIAKFAGTDFGLFESDWTPPVDVYDSDNEILVKVDIPGLKKDEIDVSIDEDLLTIKGEKKKDAKAVDNGMQEENYFRSERFFGSFSRSIQLPSKVEYNKTKATYKEGVLELHLPKKEEAKTKHIAIDVT
ncbi:MAG: Hsp20/alpha crystallin family protein [Candidatus Anammoxibacter sp.]